MSTDALYERVARILEEARSQVARTVNTAMVHAYWHIGREIVEVEQAGEQRAGYGENVVERLSARLKGSFGKGFSVQNLGYMRQFYLTFPNGSAVPQIRQAVPGKLSQTAISEAPSEASGSAIPQALPGKSGKPRAGKARAGSLASEARSATANREPMFPPALGWTHYVFLMRIANPTARAF
jgi:hypothetical protein